MINNEIILSYSFKRLKVNKNVKRLTSTSQYKTRAAFHNLLTK